MSVVFRTILLFSIAFLCWGCGGFGLGGGGDMGTMPSALEEEAPERKARLKGHIDVVDGFLPILLEGLKCPVSGGEGLPDGVLVSLAGARGFWKVELDDEGNFEFPPVYAGNYVLRAKWSSFTLVSRDISLRENSKTEALVSILGYDIPDIDNDGDRFEFLLEWTIHYGELDTEFVRTTYADGSARTILPDGTSEFYTKGMVTVRRADGDVEYREDLDNDFLPDCDDVDDDNDGIRDSRDHHVEINGNRPVDGGEDAKMRAILGKSARPLLLRTRARVIGDDSRSLSSIAPGDLILFSVETSTAGGPPLAEIEATIHRFGRPVYSFKLRDDGSERDLVAKWPGLQISGDLKRGDGVFSYVLPIDRNTLELLHESLLVFRGRNRDGAVTNVSVLPLPCRSVVDKGPQHGLVPGVGEFAVYERTSDKGERKLVARINVDEALSSGLSVFVVGPRGRKRMLTPDEDLEGGDGRIYSSSPLERRAGIYYLLMTNRTGAVYYAGFPVRLMD